MKRKGFTLIELLAVIVILAVIALIATPMIMNVIEKSKMGAFKDSVLSAFDAIEYYMIENQLIEIPEDGIDVKILNLKNNSFKSGIFIKNVDGKIEAMGISDGKYCAYGKQEDLQIRNGDCELELPKAEVVINGNLATITLTDNIGIIGYAITESEPTEWISVEPTKSMVVEWTAEHEGTYNVYIKGLYGRSNDVSFEIKPETFWSNINLLEVSNLWDNSKLSVSATTATTGKYVGSSSIITTNREVDLTNFSYITFSAFAQTDYLESYYGLAGVYGYLIDTDGNETTIFTYESRKGSVTGTASKVDLSGYNGTYKIKIRLYTEAANAGHTSRASILSVVLQ